MKKRIAILVTIFLLILNVGVFADEDGDIENQSLIKSELEVVLGDNEDNYFNRNDYHSLISILISKDINITIPELPIDYWSPFLGNEVVLIEEFSEDITIKETIIEENLEYMTKKSVHESVLNFLKSYEINNIEKNKILSVREFYNLMGQKEILDDSILTKSKLCDIIMKDFQLTFDNYGFYRSHVHDTSNINILKAYSEGFVKFEDGKANPNKGITLREANDIIEMMKNDTRKYPERPKFKEFKNIPILMYHEINPLPKDSLSGLYVDRNEFEKQIKTLTDEGFNVVTMNELYNHWEYNFALPEKPIILSFDDGYPSHYEYASKILNKYGQTGTFYIYTDVVIEGSITSPANLKTMYNEGMEIGSHTKSHADARYTNKEDWIDEITESKIKLESIINDNVNHFCYPIGGVTNTAKEELKKAGYLTAVKTTYGKANKSQGYLTLKRIRVNYHDDIKTFLNRIK